MRRLFRVLGEVLIRAGNRSPSSALKPPRPQSKSAPVTDRKFSQRATSILEHRLARRSPLVAGNIELLGLSEIRSSVGSAWNRIAENAYGVIDRVIETHLSPDDVYTRHNDETYVICFAQLNKEEAHAKVKAIVEAARSALLESVPEASPITLRQRVIAIEKPEKFPPGRSLLESIASSLEAMRQEYDRIAERQRRLLVEQASLVFVPVWLPNKESVMLYRCTLDDATTKMTFENLSMFTEPEHLQEAICELDCVMLGHAVESLHTGLKGANKAVLLLPVHYQTLDKRVHRDAYLSLCRKIPKAYSKFIIFEIYGILSDISTDRLKELVQLVRQDRFSVILLAPEELVEKSTAIATFGLYGLSLDLGAPTGQSWTEQVNRAKSRGLRTFGHGAKTLGMVTTAVEAGFDFIDGSAVASGAAEWKGTYHWTPPGLPNAV